MRHLDKTRNNKRWNQPTPDTSAEKYCDPATPEAIRIANTETTHLIITYIQKKDTSTFTEQVDSILPQ